ncbi:MAG: peptidoglycan-associated lipoprotein, partial [Bacteroidetes bacterium]|nr:peptidoglycan-associated lipoprotein [Bacteroidota bacterium]
IDPEYQSILRENAKVLMSNNRYRLLIEGHADGLEGREYGVALGQKRSEVVRKELVLYGAPESQLESVSFGKERPAVMGDDVYSMAKNRRVELVVR